MSRGVKRKQTLLAPRLDEEKKACTDCPTNRSHWVSSKLIAGAHPARDIEFTAGIVRALVVTHGVDAFVDLTEVNEFLAHSKETRNDEKAIDENQAELQNVLASLRTEDRSILYERHAIKDRFSTPAIRSIAKRVETLMQQGHTVYLFCFGGVGRTSNVVAQWLLDRNAKWTVNDAFRETYRLMDTRPVRSSYGMTYHQLRQLMKDNAARTGSRDADTMRANYAFFYGIRYGAELGCCSQFYRSPFVWKTAGGRTVSFPTSEHFMMVLKALECGDSDCARLMLTRKDPKTVKKYGREKIKNYDEDKWKAVRERVLLAGNYSKFTQNAAEQKELLATGTKTIVEASSKDRSCGIGLTAGSALFIRPENWPGNNLLGIAITKARDMIANKQPLDPELVAFIDSRLARVAV